MLQVLVRAFSLGFAVFPQVPRPVVRDEGSALPRGDGDWPEAVQALDVRFRGEFRIGLGLHVGAAAPEHLAVEQIGEAPGAVGEGGRRVADLVEVAVHVARVGVDAPRDPRHGVGDAPRDVAFVFGLHEPRT